MPMETQAWLAELRKDIVFDETICDQPLRFHTTWGLFSPRGLDEGSRLLLDHLDVEEDTDCLDMGCGYGPIGLTIAKLAPRGRTLLVDKDFVAIDYTRKNIAANGLENAEAFLSNGFSHVDDRRFDLVVSNIPAKVGKEMLSLLLHDAKASLNPGGKLVVVTINGLRDFMKRNFKEVFGNYKKLKQGKNYTVAMACKD